MNKKLDSYILILHTVTTMVAICLFLAYAVHDQEAFKAIARLTLGFMLVTTIVCVWRTLQLNFGDKDDK